MPILPIAPSTYHEHIAQRRKPARARQDIALKPEIARVFAENFAVCCVRKVWRQTMRKAFPIARCTVARLMREMGLAEKSVASRCIRPSHGIGIDLQDARTRTATGKPAIFAAPLPITTNSP